SAALNSSGIASRVALYSGNSTCRCVGASVSNATAMCVGCWFFRMSSIVWVNPYSAEVLTPFDDKMGFAINAKCARYTNAIPSSRKSFFTVLKAYQITRKSQAALVPKSEQHPHFMRVVRGKISGYKVAFSAKTWNQ